MYVPIDTKVADIWTKKLKYNSIFLKIGCYEDILNVMDVVYKFVYYAYLTYK